MSATGQELDHLFTRISMDPNGFLSGVKQVEAATAGLEQKMLAFGSTVTASLAPVTASLQGLATVFGGVASVVSGNATQAVASLSNALKDLHAPNTAAVTAIGKALTSLGESLNQFGTITAPLNLTNLAGELTGFSNALNTALMNSPNVKPFASAMDKIANLLTGSMVYRSGRLAKILPELNDFADGFQSLSGRLSTASVESAAASLGKVGGLLSAVTRFKYDGKVFGKFSEDLMSLFEGMAKLPSGSLDAASGTVGRVTSLINSMAKISPGSVGGMTVAMSTLFSGMTTAFGSLSPDAMNRGNLMIQRMGGLVKAAGTADPTKWGEMIKGIGDGFVVLSGINVSAASSAIQGIRSLGNAVARFTTVNPAVIVQSANAVRAAMMTLNATPVSLNATRVANVMNRLGNSFKNMGGGTPPPTGTLLGSLGGVPPAANAASSSLAGVNNRMSTLSATSLGLASTINGVRLSLLGLAGFGIYSFAKVDDALRRTVANMTNMGTNEPGVYEFFKRGAAGVASRSTSSQLDLVNALGQLTAAGYSAGGAMDSLMTAENFAVASGMKLADATRRLVDLQAALGMGDESSFEKTSASLSKLSDMMVLAAKRSGSTEAQIADAFTGKFTTAMHRVRMGAEEGMAVLSTLSKLNHSFRGAAGGDTAARAIGVITNAASQNADVWRGLGIKGINKDGSFSSLTDLLDELHKFAGTDMAKGMSQLRLSGLGENLRVVTGVETLINYGKTIRQLTDEMVDAGGTSQRTADIIRDSLLSQLKMLWNNAQLTASVFGDALSPALSGLIGGLNGLLSAFVELNPAVQLLAVSAAALLIGFRPMISLLTFALTPVTLLIGSIISLTTLTWGLVTSTYAYRTAGLALTGLWLVQQGVVKVLTVSMLSLWTAVTSVYTAFRTGQAFVYAFVAVAAVVASPLVAITSAVAGLAYGVFYLGKALNSVWDGAVFVFTNFSKLAATAGLAVANLGLSLLSGLATFAVTAVAAFVVLPPLIALVAAPIVTIGIGLSQLVGVIGGGLVRAWGAAKEAAVGALGWVGGKMAEIGEGVRSMWSSLRSSIVGFLNGVRPIIEYTSGLLWNYKYNLEVVFRWLNKYGEQAFKDLGNAAFMTIEAVTGNIQQMALFLGNVFVTVVSTLWSNLTRTGFSFFAWFRNQWTNILGDVNGLFMTFTSNLMQNFLVLAEAGYSILADMAKELATNPLGRTFATEALAKKYLAEKDAERQAVLNKAYQGLRGPFDGVGKSSTDFGMLSNSLKHVWDVALPQQWDRAGKDMATAFSERFKQMNPVLAGFAALNKSPIWVELFTKLNGSLPNNALGEFGKWFMQMVKPDLDNKDEAGNAVPGGTNGPGFTFKQTSSARTMLGGEAAENLDFQQLVTLKQIKGILQDIAQAKGVVFDGNMPKFLKLKEGN